MTELRHYLAYGRTIRSEMELPLREADPAPADVVLTVDPPAPVPANCLDREAPDLVAIYDVGQEEGPWYVATEGAEGYSIAFRNTGVFRISRDLSQVVCTPVSGGFENILPVLFSGTVLALLLTLAEGLVLHASAVTSGDRTLAIVGQSGRGKSTVATLCAADGARVVTDDVLLVDPAGANPGCLGNGGELRLREGARSLAARFEGSVSERETADARLGLLAEDAETGWTALRAIMIPNPSREAETLVVRRLSASDALLTLLGFPRIDGLRKPHSLSTQFRLHAQLVEKVPVYSVTIPWGPPFADGLGSQILEVLDRADQLEDPADVSRSLSA